MIMDRIDGWRRVLEPFVVLRIAASDEILGISDAAAIIEAGRDGPKAAPVHAQASTRCVLAPRRITDKASLQHRSQARDSLGKQDAIDPVLHVRVFVADMIIGIAYR